ncbi:MAG TPA: hypothetical protein VK031_06565 [Tissierellaceae bacterium]|nr:hypothetical protein [Tissierellaceae bacterium]
MKTVIKHLENIPLDSSWTIEVVRNNLIILSYEDMILRLFTKEGVANGATWGAIRHLLRNGLATGVDLRIGEDKITNIENYV